MKKNIFFLLFFSFSLMAFSQSNIRIYSEPSSISEIVAIVVPGPEIKIIDSSVSYYHKIEYKGKVGWISKSQWTKYLNGSLNTSAGNSNNSNSLNSTTPKKATSTGRKYIRGPKGGCYYINSNGNKTYVDRSLCN